MPPNEARIRKRNNELQASLLRYHFPYNWAAGDRAIKDRLVDGLYIAALPLDVTVETLVEALQKDDVQQRLRAAIALGKIGPAAEAAIPALTAMQDDEIIGALAKQTLKDIRGF